jgi:hypothetical protein
MSKICNTCGYEYNPDNAEFCDTCGAELATGDNSPSVNSPPVSETAPTLNFAPGLTPPNNLQSSISTTPNLSPVVIPAPELISTPPALSIPSAPNIPNIPSVSSTATAKLIAKAANAPIAEFEIDTIATIGTFTSESGPVDIDLADFPGGETISKQHAEIIYQNGDWILKDISSNGTFIKPVGQSRFGARIMTPTQINSDDEIAFAKVIFVFQAS